MADLPPTVEMSGRRIRDQVINEGQPSNAKRRAEELMAIGESPGYLFWRVVRQYSMGNPVPLIKYLCTNHPLSPTDRKLLALTLAEAFGRRPNHGRPRGEHTRAVAAVAKRIYRQWKSELRREGIKSHGLSDEMKDQSCRYAIEILTPVIERVGGTPPEYEAAREMMERSIYRQK